MDIRQSGRRFALAAALSGALGACRWKERDAEPAHAGHPPGPADAAPCHLALVLSGGGLRGFAHVGVLGALHDMGVVPDLVVGCSAGALVGGLFAAGMDAPALRAAALDPRLDDELERWAGWLVLPSLRSTLIEGWLRGRLTRGMVQDFERRFIAVATRRDDGAAAALGRGDAARAILASASVPGVLPPVRIGDAELIDGGLSSPLPVLQARAHGAAHVLAVDVSFHPMVPAPTGRINSMFHAGLLMTRNLALDDRKAADVLIEPALPPVPQITLARRAELVACGYRATMVAAPHIAALIA